MGDQYLLTSMAAIKTKIVMTSSEKNNTLCHVHFKNFNAINYSWFTFLLARFSGLSFYFFTFSAMPVRASLNLGNLSLTLVILVYY
ncbi:hypothetical protein RG47T_5018 [Mucilaginibacter polytrichastri]|uniref:Uncharacterized protein n=1 Tax=Mucilaginibacter polytrichastri TaxID=1302689 RepID=A0A1Q6A6A4_9SPHI|nr:hypothetical protein RG47T_5018 [Mucilaginibacter polytrichastri]